LGFGHGPELIILLAIALIVLGPGKIPEVAQMLGKGIRELRKASSELQQTFDVNALMNPPEAPLEAPEAAPPPAVEVPVEHTIMPSPPEPISAVVASPAQPLPGPASADLAARPKRPRKRAVAAQSEAPIDALALEPLEVDPVSAVAPEDAAMAIAPGATAAKPRPARRRTAGAAPEGTAPEIEMASAVLAEASGTKAPTEANSASLDLGELVAVAPANSNGADRTAMTRRPRRKTTEPVTADTSA